MKIFEKGKLFGILNIVDLIIILLIIGAIWGLFAKTKVTKKLEQNYEVKPVKILFLVENVRQYTVDVVKPGDALREFRSGEQMGKIKEIRTEPHKEKAPDAQGNWRMSPVPGKIDIYLTVEGKLKSYNKELRVGQADVKVGSKLTLKSTLYNLMGVIIKVEVLD